MRIAWTVRAVQGFFLSTPENCDFLTLNIPPSRGSFIAVLLSLRLFYVQHQGTSGGQTPRTGASGTEQGAGAAAPRTGSSGDKRRPNATDGIIRGR